MRVLPYLFYLILIAIHVVILQDLTAVYAATINLPALIVLLVAVYKDDVPATWFGFFAGLTAAAGLPFGLGWHALVMAALALAVWYVRQRLNLESLGARLLLVVGGVLLHNVATLVIVRADSFVTLLWASALTGAVYTTIFAWLFFLAREGRVTYQKIRALF